MATTSRRGFVAKPTIGYELVDFNQQPINLYATELAYCEPHWHEAAELNVVLSGSFEVLLGSRSIRLKKGGMVFVQADDLHTVHAREEHSALLAVQFSPKLDGVWGVRCGRDPSVVVEGLRPEEPVHRDLMTSVADLVRHVLHREPMFGDYGLLKRVFALLEMVSLVAESSVVPEDPEKPIGGERQMDIAKRAIAYANEHYLDDIKLVDVAEAMGVSYHHLSHTFNAVSGFSFREYLTLLRVNKARELLRDETLNITQISNSSGFSEHKHLDAAFKKYFATTPTQYRKKYMNQLLVCREAVSDGVNRLLSPPEVESLLHRLTGSIA